MDNKTALQQIKGKLQVVANQMKGLNDNYNLGYRTAMENVIKDIDAQMLETEKNQIIEAYDEGFKDGGQFPTKFSTEDWFKNKYNQP